MLISETFLLGGNFLCLILPQKKKRFVSFLFEKTVKILLIQFQTVGGWIRHETSPTDKEAIVKNLGENYHKWHILRKLTALTDTF